MHPFNYFEKPIQLHSGEWSHFKIDCDALFDEDIEALAAMVHKILPPYGMVWGVPKGGLRFADAMRKYTTPYGHPWLIVDDVLTTGASMNEAKAACKDESAIGLVIFSRIDFLARPSWIRTIFEPGLLR